MDSLIWDATFPLLRLEGSGCAGFLHGQTSASVSGASEGKLIPACWLNATAVSYTHLTLPTTYGV